MIKFKEMFSNVFQFSTLRALAVVLGAFGISVPEPLISGISTGVIALYGLIETFTDRE